MAERTTVVGRGWVVTWAVALLGAAVAWAWSYAGYVYLDRGRVLAVVGDATDVGDCLGFNRIDPQDGARLALLMSTRIGWYAFDREVHHAPMTCGSGGGGTG